MAGLDRVTKRWPLVGRDVELDRFAEVLAAGDRAAYLVYGPAGVGKTRLAEECLTVAERAGRPVARVVAGRVAADLPFGAIAHLLPAGLEADGDPGRLAEQVRRELRGLAGDGRLVLFVDDFPLLDALSLTLLTQLANAGALLLVATLRTGEPTPDALASLWSGDRVARVDLTDLDRDGSDALLHEVLGNQVGIRTLAEFWQAGRGNPLYLRELLWGAVHEGWLDDADGVWQLTGPLPNSPRLLELVGARIGAVGAEGRAVLERLALCQPLGLDELDATDDVLETIEAAGLVQVRPDRRRHVVTLAHPVYAQVIQGSMTRVRIRGALTEQARRFQGYGLRRREDALRVATWQLSATGTADPRLLLSAGRLARHTPDHAGLERLARGALAAEESVEARVLLAEALHAVCRFEEAEEVLAGADGLPAPEGLRQRLISLRAITLAWGLGRPDQAAATLDEGIRALAPEYRGELVALAALQLTTAEQPRRALERLSEWPIGGDDGDASGDEGAVGDVDRAARDAGVSPRPAGGEADGVHASVSHPGPRPRRSRLRTIAESHALAAVGQCSRADSLIEAGRRPWNADEAESLFVHAGSSYMAEAFADYAAGRMVAATAAMTSALEYAVEDDLSQSQASYAWNLGRILLARGRPRTAARWARDGIAVANSRALTGPARLSAACLATALAVSGDAEGAEARVAELEAFPASLGMVAQARAWTAAARDDTATARRILLAAAGEAAAQDRHTFSAELLHDAARLGDPKTSLPVLEELAKGCDSPLISARADHTRALARRDPRSLDEVADRFAAMGLMVVAAEAAVAAAAAWRDHGDTRRATASTTRANELSALCEGARTPGLAAMERAAGPLTQREAEICRLAAAGVPSRDIADRLFLSVRTVNNHLQNSYTKLGVGSRRELVDALRGP